MCLQLVICCLWTFLVQVIIMSYYLFSAELPSAVLRGKFIIHNPESYPLSSSLTPYSQDRARHFLHQLSHGYCHVVRPFEFIPRVEIPS